MRTEEWCPSVSGGTLSATACYVSIVQPIRIAAVRYLNTAPLIEGLDQLEGVKLMPTIPAAIAPMVMRNEADLGLASIVDAARSNGTLAILPVGMIGCDGPTLTVRIFSKAPMHEIDTLHTDTDSHTSVILARLLLAKQYDLHVEVARFDARERVLGSGLPIHSETIEEAWPRSVLLIGDKVVTDHPPESRYPYQLDLGDAWKKLTGLPFVYAAWVCRAAEAMEPQIRTAAAILDRQLRHNQTRLDWIVSSRAREAHWPEPLARRYIGELLRYRLGPREREAVGVFLREARSLGLIERDGVEWA